MQGNSTAGAQGSLQQVTSKNVSTKQTSQQPTSGPVYQVKGSASATAPFSSTTSLGGAAQILGMTPNTPEEQKLATAQIFRPLGGGMASSTSPSTALFGTPLFQLGLPNLPDGSTEDNSAMPVTSGVGANLLAGSLGSSSLGGSGSGLLFGPLSSGEAGGAGTQENKAADLRSGQISASFVPLGGNNGRLGSGLLFGGEGAGATLSEQPSAGELITGTYATYRGPIDLMVPQLAQDHDKSLDTLSDLNISKAKTFRCRDEPHKTVQVFLAQNARNISFVINQDELVDNVINVATMEQLGFKKDKGEDLAHINDFTLIDFQYLIVLMNQGRIVIFDCSMVFEGSAPQVRYINQDKIKPQASTSGAQDDLKTGDVGPSSESQQTSSKSTEQAFMHIESMEASRDFESRGGSSGIPVSSMQADHDGSEPRRVLVYGKQANRLLCLEIPRSDSPDMDMMDPPVQAELQIPSKLENRQIIDFAVMADSKHVAILFSDSLIMVFNLALRTAVFKAKYNDATDNISQLYFVAENHLEAPTKTQFQQLGSSPSSDTTLMGFFLLVETKLVQKDTPKVTKNGEKQISVSRSKHLRKLHLVQVQQTQVMSRSKIEKRDKIEQLDALTFGEETPKLVDFVRCKNNFGVPNYFAFLLTRERVKSNGALKLITVKMRWAPNEEHKNDNSFEQDEIEETKKASANKANKDDARNTGNSQSGFQSKWKLKFDFVTSLRPKIENFRGDKQKPNYLNVIEASEESNMNNDDTNSVGGEENQDNMGAGADDENGQDSMVFYIYTGVGNQSVVFKRKYSEISHAHSDERNQRQQIKEAKAQMVQALAGKKQKKKNVGADNQHVNYDDYLERMNQEHQRDKEQIKAQLAKQIKDAVSEMETPGEDPAIISQTPNATNNKGTINPESQNPETSGNQQQKTKKVAGRDTSGKRSRPSSAKRHKENKQAAHVPPALNTAASMNSAQANQSNMAQGPAQKSKTGTPAPPVRSDSLISGNKDGVQNQESQQKSATKNGKDGKVSKEQQQQQSQQQQTTGVAGATAVTVPPTKKQQQDQIIENYQELNKKFTELHMKMNSLQQQVKAQKDLQIQVEQTITKAVKTALPEIVKKQVEETVAPLMQKQTEMLDNQIRTTLIPRIEAHLQRMGGVSQGSAPGQTTTATSQLMPSLSPKGGVTVSSQLTDSQVRKIIHHEFKQAMASQIMPELERELKQMLSKVKEPITNFNKIFYEKLINEEQKSDHIVQVFEQRLQYVQQQAHQAQQYQAAMAPPPNQPMQHLQQPQMHHQSFSLHPQASQTSFTTAQPQLAPQPIAIYQQQPPQPQQHYQVHHMPAAQHGQQMLAAQQHQQQQQQLFNVSQDTSMVASQLLNQQAPAPQQPQQQLTNQLQQQQTQQPTPFHSQNSFGGAQSMGNQQQQQQQIITFQPQPQPQTLTTSQNGGFIQTVLAQAPQQPAALAQQQPPLQQQIFQQQPSMQNPSLTQQLQPTNTSFVPTTSMNNGGGQNTTNSQLQQNVSAPTFIPQQALSKDFHPTNTIAATQMPKVLSNVTPSIIKPLGMVATSSNQQTSVVQEDASTATVDKQKVKFGGKDAVIDTKQKQPTSDVVGEVAAVVETEADKTDGA